MAQLEISNRNKRTAHRNTRVDLTPMVDLGFLLITFFIFTTTLSEPTAMKLVMPDNNGIDDPIPVSKKMVLTILPDANDKAAVYEGDLTDNPVIEKADLNHPSSLRNLIIQKQKRMVTGQRARKDLVVIIKPGEKSTYKNLVDVLDEMLINGVKKYAVVKRSLKDEEVITKVFL